MPNHKLRENSVRAAREGLAQVSFAGKDLQVTSVAKLIVGHLLDHHS